MSGLPEGWESSTLEEVCGPDAPIIYGILQPGPEIDGGVLYVRPTEIRGGEIDLQSVRRTSHEIAKKYSRSVLKTDDLLLSIVGTIGKVAKVPPELDGGNITQSSCRVRPSPEVADGDFVSHFLKSPLARTHYGDNRLGTAVPRLNLADVRKFDIPIPPLEEQRRIVEKLDRLSARSCAAKDHLAHVQTLATRAKQATLAAAFRGELTAGWRSNDDTKQSDEMLFEIPSSWEWRKAEELCDWITKGTTPKKIDLSAEKGDVPFIKVYNLTFDGSLDFTKEPTFVGTETHHGLLRRSKIYPGDILMNIVGPPLGKVSMVPDTYPEWNMNQAIAVFRPRQMILHGYLIQWLLSATYLKWAQSVSKATAGQRNLTLEICRNSPVPLPPLVEQTEIVRRIEAAFARIDRMVEEASRAAKLLDRLEAELLAKAFRGELVPQDPNDEPASALLARIREARASAPKPKRKRRS